MFGGVVRRQFVTALWQQRLERVDNAARGLLLRSHAERVVLRYFRLRALRAPVGSNDHGP